ncbi:MAG: zinc ABC transporter substrate-binding protein [Actinobacteria bacterium]|nr:zinc ABC transporter substrate-binding protein [Actinomycetota bacterium]
MKRLGAVTLVFALLGGVLVGCGGGEGDGGEADGRLPVVAAFYPLAEAASRVGENRVAVTNLTPAGTEPHELELTPDQVDRIQDAAVVLVMGDGFQPAVEAAAAARDGQTVELLAEVAPPGGAADPHVWLDPVVYARVVDAVAEALSTADPDGAEEYAARARRLADEIATVDREYAAGLARCDRRTIVTAHEAFGWLARRYDLTQEGIAGLAPDQEPTPKRLAELADLADREGVTTVFTEELVSPRVAETLAREAGGLQTAVLHTLEGLSDEELARGDDWASVMRSNLRALRHALGCS